MGEAHYQRTWSFFDDCGAENERLGDFSFLFEKTRSRDYRLMIRTALAEKDVCGGLEVVVVAPNTPFQEKWMMDGHADVGRVTRINLVLILSLVRFCSGRCRDMWMDFVSLESTWS